VSIGPVTNASLSLADTASTKYWNTYNNNSTLKWYLSAAAYSTTGATGDVMALTSTGLNSTAIGATTPSTVAATTLSASGASTFTNSAPSVIGGLGFRNRIINGDMRIDQRNEGTAVTNNSSNNGYGLDRFIGNGMPSDGVFTMQRSTTAPAGFTNSLLITVTTADASIAAADRYFFATNVEGLNCSDFGFGTASAKTVTLSFWVRSSVTGTFSGSLSNNAYDRAYPFTYTINAADTFEYKTITIPGDTSGTWLTTNGIGIRIYIDLGAGANFRGTAGSWSGTGSIGATSSVNLISTASATWYLTGVQLEIGNAATEFERRPFGLEFSLCERYFEKNTPNKPGTATDSSGIWPMGRTTISSGVHYLRILFRTVKRTTVHTMTIMPYTTPANTGRVSESATGTDQAANSGSPQSVTERGFDVANLSGGALSISANEAIYFTWTADAEF
jgi:hypothetical protein